APESRMARHLILSAVLAAVLLAGDGPPAVPAREPAPVEAGKPRPGMTQDEVRQRLGPPKRTARQILYRRYLEQWVYEGANPVRIEFDCVRGKEPQILTVQPLSPPRP
ncbi:MAG TPA: hypothetical protein VFW33_01550, partial [Gemmataceae bacterium]|nr:hypothetical protein [Gemmataceae bacterium]